MFGIASNKEFITRLHWREDGALDFLKSEIHDTFAVKKRGEEVEKAWKFLYKLMFKFDGFGHIQPCQLIMTYDRDIILDPFKKVKESDDVPKKGTNLDKAWISR